MNDVILQLIENCEIDFNGCYDDTCPIFAQCEQWRKEHKEYFVVTIDEITDEQIERHIAKLSESLVDISYLEDDQKDKYWDMDEEDRIKFDNDFQDRVLELLQKRINGQRSK